MPGEPKIASDFVTRRETLKYAAAITLAARSYLGVHGYAERSAPGYGLDPNLLGRPVTWAKRLTPDQLASLTALCDMILPAEPPHPSAAASGVQDFLNEWASAPYPQMRADCSLILRGLATLDALTPNSEKRFAHASRANQALAFDSLCANPDARPFAQRLIELICAGYYTTGKGHAAIGYVGNVPRESFDPPSPDIIRHFQAVLAEAQYPMVQRPKRP